MVILKAVGAFFIKIGRWIKETAWVQPLLIVGGIFAIIFTIPYIIKGFQSLADVNEAVSYYNKFDISIENEKSKGDQLFKYLENYEEATAEQKKNFGEKFFITFVTESGDNSSYYEGYEVLQSESKKKDAIELKGGNFKLYTIYIDSKNDDDEKYFNETQSNFFSRHELFFEHTQSLVDCPYAETYGSGYESTLGNVANPDSFASNTVFLIDLTETKPDYANKYGVSEIFFSVSGSDKYKKAYFLRDAWNHEGDFAAE